MVTVKLKPDLVPKNNIPFGSGLTLSIQYRQRRNGQKFLDIYVSKPTWPVSKYRYLPKILVPTGTREQKHMEQQMYFPFWALPQLREQMVQMLEENDGSEPIDEMPTIPEWATREKVEEGDAENKLNLAKYFLSFGHNRQICIQCDQGRSGQKVIKIFLIIVVMMKRSHHFRPKEPAIIHARLPKIRVPQQAYKFLGALDGLIGQLPVEAPAHPLESGKSQQRTILARQMADCEDGKNKGFTFSVVWHQNDGQWYLHIHSVKIGEKHKKWEVNFPLWALPQLHQQMATILAEHDGTERIDEMPKIPEWATRDAPNIEQQEQQLYVDCSLCAVAVANVKYKDSKCWWHTAKSRDWPIADHSGMGNTSKCRHRPSS